MHKVNGLNTKCIGHLRIAKCSQPNGKPDHDIDALNEKTPQKTAGFFNLVFAKP